MSLGEPPVAAGLSPTVVPKRLLVHEARMVPATSNTIALRVMRSNFTLSSNRIRDLARVVIDLLLSTDVCNMEPAAATEKAAKPQMCCPSFGYQLAVAIRLQTAQLQLRAESFAWPHGRARSDGAAFSRQLKELAWLKVIVSRKSQRRRRSR